MTASSQLLRLYAVLVGCSCILTVFWTWSLIRELNLTLPFVSNKAETKTYCT
ncbi:hypothetical protein BV25DRAFT_1831740 [Artomyces pyxidatus]|uniref:Uncharacterized protein n=1 Tax=Artomyces pyxidatus TaxID=48021 RepID=A0ACB8SK52_9AGAM|nr:hypothetical protein BV25DRAFT_1831740 [Artomyces pyxidatus]